MKNIKKYIEKYPKKYRDVMRQEREIEKEKYEKILDMLFQEEVNNVRLEYLNEIGIETIRIKL